MEAIHNAGEALTEENYMIFAIKLAFALEPELSRGPTHALSPQQLQAVLRTLQAAATDKFFLENTLKDSKRGFAAFRHALTEGFDWRDIQTKGAVMEFLDVWEGEISDRIYRTKKQYLTSITPIPDDEVLALRQQFKKKMVAP